MDYRDKKYINRVAENVDGHIYEYLILPDETRIYVNPEAFEAYIRTLPADLWAPEFRNAYDTITMYRGPQNDEETEKYLNDALAALRLLAVTYCQQIAAELESQQPDSGDPRSSAETANQGAAQPELPAALKSRPEARTAFDSLVEAGYLDREYKPTKFDEGKPKANIYSYIARTVCDLLNITYYCKIFGPYFGINSDTIKASYRQVMAAQGLQPWRAEINKALARAAQDDDRLGRTQKGKELIKELQSKHK